MSISLEDMIKKIVEIDEQAQKITKDAEQDNVNALKQVAEQRKKLSDEYLARARKRIDILKQEEQNKANKILADTKEKFQSQASDLENIYKNNCDTWVEAIFNRVIGE